MREPTIPDDQLVSALFEILKQMNGAIDQCNAAGIEVRLTEVDCTRFSDVVKRVFFTVKASKVLGYNFGQGKSLEA